MLLYFEGEHGVLSLDRHRITGAQERRKPTEFPTRVLVDYAPGHFDVRNGFDDVQKRLMAGRDAEALLQCDQGTALRAADMLTAYGELIRRDGASHVEQHHYLPDVEFVAAELRNFARHEPDNVLVTACP